MCRQSVYGLTLDLYPHQRLQDKDVLPLTTVQIHEFPSAQGPGSFASLEDDMLSLIESKYFISGSMTRQALSNHILDLNPSPNTSSDSSDHDSVFSSHLPTLSFHRQDPTLPGSLCPEPYPPGSSVSSVPDAILEDGRSMVAVLLPWASEGLVLRSIGDTQDPFGSWYVPTVTQGPLERAQQPQLRQRAELSLTKSGVAAKAAQSRGFPPSRSLRVVRRPAPFPVSLSVLTELYGEVRLEVPSRTTVGEVLDKIQCSEGIPPRDRQLVLYEVRRDNDLGAARFLSDMASPLSDFAAPGAAALPLALHGEVEAVARAERQDLRRRERARTSQAREALLEGIGGRAEGEFYLFAEPAEPEAEAAAGEDTVLLESLRPDGTVEALMAEVERRMGIPQRNQLLLHKGRFLLKHKGDRDPPPSVSRPLLETRPDADEEEEDRPAWAPPEATKKKRVGASLTLLDYRVDPDSTIRVGRARPFPIFVKNVSGHRVVVAVRPSDRVRDVKVKLQETEGVPIDKQRLIYAGRQLEDGRLLTDSGIRKEDTLSRCTWF